MKRILVLGILGLFVISAVSAQDDSSIKSTSDIDPNTLEDYLSMGCGKGGSASPSFIYHKSLIANKDYNTIRENLYSDVNVVSLLSALTLEHLANAEQVKLSKKEMSRIKKVKSSKEEIQVCVGCTYLEDQSMSSLFLENDSNRASVGFDQWMQSQFMIEK